MRVAWCETGLAVKTHEPMFWVGRPSLLCCGSRKLGQEWRVLSFSFASRAFVWYSALHRRMC